MSLYPTSADMDAVRRVNRCRTSCLLDALGGLFTTQGTNLSLYQQHYYARSLQRYNILQYKFRADRQKIVLYFKHHRIQFHSSVFRCVQDCISLVTTKAAATNTLILQHIAAELAQALAFRETTKKIFNCATHSEKKKK